MRVTCCVVLVAGMCLPALAAESSGAVEPIETLTLSPVPMQVPAAPPPSLMPPPQQQQLPPGEAFILVPGPSPEELDAFERAGRHKRTAGIALMSGGGGLVLLGTALIIAGVVVDDDDHCHRPTIDNRFDGNPNGNFGCGGSGLAFAGAWTAVIGTTSLAIGIPLYIGGTHQIARVRDLRRRLVIMPSLHATSRGASAGLGAAF